MDFAIIGLGWAGQKHALTLSRTEGAELLAVADSDPETAGRIAEATGARAYPDWRALFEGETDLDAVVLAGPSAQRLQLLDEICDRELAVFCEAPPAISLDGALKAARAIRRAGVPNAVCMQYRWSLAGAALRELIRQRPRLFASISVALPVFDWVREGAASATLYRKGDSGGPLIEHGVQFQDALRWVTGDDVLSVHALAELGGQHPADGRDAEETTVLAARHRSGLLSTHVHNWSHRGSLARLQVVGPTFDLTWDMTGEERLTGWLEGEAVDERSGVDCYADALREFVEAVRRRDQNLIRCDFAEACRSLAVCEAGNGAIEAGGALPVPDVAQALTPRAR
jgi:predicted dehydrogenase